MDGRMDGRMDGQTDVWKFTPVSYRTWAFWGCCPKRILIYTYHKSSSTKVFEKTKCQLQMILYTLLLTCMRLSLSVYPMVMLTRTFSEFAAEGEEENDGEDDQRDNHRCLPTCDCH